MPHLESKANFAWRAGGPGELSRRPRYRSLWLLAVLTTSFVTVTPLVILAGVNYHQYERSLEQRVRGEVEHQVFTMRRSLESFLEERAAALRFIVNERDYDELIDRRSLNAIFQNLKSTFGKFVDLTLIDAHGEVLSYVSAIPLQRNRYTGQEWFDAVLARRIHVSDVFMGYRNFPHFVIAIASEDDQGSVFVLRASVDAKILTDLIAPPQRQVDSDAFILNPAHVLQTPTRFCRRGILDRCPLEIPSRLANNSLSPILWEDAAPAEQRLFFGAVTARRSPFFCVVAKRVHLGPTGYFGLRRQMLGFTLLGAAIIVLLVMGMASYLILRIRRADQQRTRSLHGVEYANKMASLGRLAAGVAHEINNPLASMNEKAGLLRDIRGTEKDSPSTARDIDLIDSILSAVDRCRSITHRLLGFARRIDTQSQSLRVDFLLDEVVSFLETEARQREIHITRSYPDAPPMIHSDRGQLQQVFLNILNNAFDAIEDGGRIEIAIQTAESDQIAVTINDNGCGIPAEDLQHIFEPFFTKTRRHSSGEYGTGLGLSITYGIVTKLGGTIEVSSAPGEGASFTITLPVQPQADNSNSNQGQRPPHAPGPL